MGQKIKKLKKKSRIILPMILHNPKRFVQIRKRHPIKML